MWLLNCKKQLVLGLSVLGMVACQPKRDVRFVPNANIINPDNNPAIDPNVINVPKEILHAANCGVDSRAEQVTYYSTIASIENWAKKRRIAFDSYDSTQYQDAILVSRGVKPTGGYMLHFVQGEYDMFTRDWNLTLNWINPAPEAILTMAETYPCSVIIFPKSRPWQGLTLLDQQKRAHLRYQREKKEKK